MADNEKGLVFRERDFSPWRFSQRGLTFRERVLGTLRIPLKGLTFREREFGPWRIIGQASNPYTVIVTGINITKGVIGEMRVYFETNTPTESQAHYMNFGSLVVIAESMRTTTYNQAKTCLILGVDWTPGRKYTVQYRNFNTYGFDTGYVGNITVTVDPAGEPSFVVN